MTQTVVEVIPHSPNLSDYDTVAIAFSGGKDSVAAVLHVIDEGVPINKIILLHHDVDGEDSDLMDWPCTKAYCIAFAKHFDMRIFFSWKVGGFEGEMLRENALTKPVTFEATNGARITVGGVSGKKNTRLKFPQTAADLRTRWCSAYLKVDVGSKVLIHDPLFKTGKTLFITGERAEESASRAKYQTFQPHMADNRNGKKASRHIDHWRPVHAWNEKEVWLTLQRHQILAHPAYHLGWGRTSCLACIFGSANQWATIKKYMPEKFNRIAEYEKQFGLTINRKLSVEEQASKGKPYDCDPKWLEIALSTEFTANIHTPYWRLPAGAFGESVGPT